MSASSYSLTEAEVAARLHIRVRTLKARCAEANVRGIKPGRERLFSEADFAALVAYLAQRATNLKSRNPPGGPVNIRRTQNRADTKRLLKNVERPVVKLGLETQAAAAPASRVKRPRS